MILSEKNFFDLADEAAHFSFPLFCWFLRVLIDKSMRCEPWLCECQIIIHSSRFDLKATRFWLVAEGFLTRVLNSLRWSARVNFGLPCPRSRKVSPLFSWPRAKKIRAMEWERFYFLTNAFLPQSWRHLASTLCWISMLIFLFFRFLIIYYQVISSHSNHI